MQVGYSPVDGTTGYRQSGRGQVGHQREIQLVAVLPIQPLVDYVVQLPVSGAELQHTDGQHGQRLIIAGMSRPGLRKNQPQDDHSHPGSADSSTGKHRIRHCYGLLTHPSTIRSPPAGKNSTLVPVFWCDGRIQPGARIACNAIITIINRGSHPTWEIPCPRRPPC